MDEDTSLSDTVSITRRLSEAWYAHHDVWLTESVRGRLKLISELLCIKHHYLKLDFFDADEGHCHCHGVDWHQKVLSRLMKLVACLGRGFRTP